MCCKKFKYKEIQLRHFEAAHKDNKIYCHFYNNNLECQFGEKKYAFLHEDSEVFLEVNETENTFSNPSQSEENSLETLKFMVSAPCRDKNLANDQKYYLTELEKFIEISKVKKVCTFKAWFEIGTNLETYVEFETKFGENSKVTRHLEILLGPIKYERDNTKRLKSLNVEETCPN